MLVAVMSSTCMIIDSLCRVTSTCKSALIQLVYQEMRTLSKRSCVILLLHALVLDQGYTNYYHSGNHAILFLREKEETQVPPWLDSTKPKAKSRGLIPLSTFVAERIIRIHIDVLHVEDTHERRRGRSGSRDGENTTYRRHAKYAKYELQGPE